MKQLSIGANLANFELNYLYRQNGKDPIPTNLQVGIAYRVLDSEFNRFTVLLRHQQHE
ncbi:MAG: hypothetical protein R3C26_08115 [Calditrichia bacterium]